MRLLLLIVVVGVLGFLGYEYLVRRAEEPPRSVEDATARARDAAGEAVSAAREALATAGQAIGPAAEQAGEAIRQGAEQIQEGARQLAREAQEAAGEATDGVDLGLQMQEAVGRARAALVGATDAPSVEAQLPALRDVDTTLAAIQEKLDALSADARRSFAGLVAETLPTLQSMAERVKALDGVGPEVDAVIDSIINRLEGWARAPA